MHLLLKYVTNYNNHLVVINFHLSLALQYLPTLCLIVWSADNFCKSLEPDPARRNVGPDLNPNCLTL